MKSSTVVAIAFLFVTSASNISAATIEGVTFDKDRIEQDHKLMLRGAGLFRYMYFIKAYAGALYLPENIPSGEALSDVPKRLEVSYFHAIKGKDFGPATIAGIRKNVDEATFARIRDQIELHNALYENVQPGDRYALTYIPGRGTSLSLNGTELGVVPGAEFASALFAIWLGPRPLNQDFKNDILGKG